MAIGVRPLKTPSELAEALKCTLVMLEDGQDKQQAGHICKQDKPIPAPVRPMHSSSWANMEP